jgi:bifunctional UDP-N-acetylglucosamine pyrophosphorylase/glucosamine-1-phosphate N-acetyltransferase
VEQLGTADALKSYFTGTPGAWETDFTLVMCADTPLVSEKEIVQLFNVIKNNHSLQAVCATFEAHNPYGYGQSYSS